MSQKKAVSKRNTKQKQSRKKSSSPKSTSPAWKAKWPRGGDLRAWLRCMIDKCEAMEDLGDACNEAHLPIEGLADLGYIQEALRFVNRFLRRLPKTANVETVIMHELAAEIHLKAGDLQAAEKHLERILRLDNSGARKCDIGFPAQSVRDFKELHGLLDPSDAEDEEQAVSAEFSRAERLAKELIGRRKFQKARDQILIMERAAKETNDEFIRSLRLKSTLGLYGKTGDKTATRRVMRNLSADDREEVLTYDTLLSLGMHRESIRCAERQVKKELEELASMEDPNIHFPVNGLCDALEFLVDQDETKRARRLLKRVFAECSDWPVYEFGWTTSAVYTMLARVVAKIDGPEAAKALLESAREDASGEKRPGWRKGAVRGAIELEADLGYLDEAILRARKLRSPGERRAETAMLLARAKRWKELREVCQEVTSPTEAAALCWIIKFELAGGEAR